MSAWSEWGEGSLIAKEEVEEDDTINTTSEISIINFEPTKHSRSQYCVWVE